MANRGFALYQGVHMRHVACLLEPDEKRQPSKVPAQIPGPKTLQVQPYPMRNKSVADLSTWFR